MYLHGAIDRNPVHGCTTFRTDLHLGRIPGQMAVTLSDLDTTVRSCGLDTSEIEIQRVKTKEGYQLSTGRYFGHGLPVYLVTCDIGYFYVRATSRKELRAALKLLYPHCKVGR
jgi:hypothetical protein